MGGRADRRAPPGRSALLARLSRSDPQPLPRLAAAALVLVLAALAALAGPGQAGAAARTPAGFFGTVADRAYDDPRLDRRLEISRMARAGVESLRLPLYWQAIQPHASRAAVPADQAARFAEEAGGVPSDFSALDAAVETAARRSIRILPVVLGSPTWAARDPGSRLAIDGRMAGGAVPPAGAYGAYDGGYAESAPNDIDPYQSYEDPRSSYYAPAPVYSQPRRYYAPAPIQYAPAPIYYEPAPVYYVAPRPYYGPSISIGIQGGHHRHHRHHGYERPWR